MKKITALLAVLSCMTVIPLGCAYSDGSVKAVEINDPQADEKPSELQVHARKLGAEKDSFNFMAEFAMSYPPYTDSSDYMHQIEEYYNEKKENFSLTDYTKHSRRDCSAGMAILQMAVHNGDIQLSDLKQGVTSLKDAEFDYTLNQKIYDTGNQLFDDAEIRRLIGSAICWESDEERTDRLLSTAKQAEEEGKYFLIAVRLSKPYIISMTGIGLAEGNWKFNGKTYDKCVLTLDPIGDTNKKIAGFSEDACIYINSKTKEYYIPRYRDQIIDKYARIEYIETNAQTLLERGKNKDINEQLKGINILNKDEYIYDLTVNSKGESHTFHGSYVQYPEGLTKNVFVTDRKNDLVYDGVTAYLPADSISVDTEQDEEADNYGSNIQFGIGLNTSESVSGVTGYGLFRADINIDKIVYENKPTYYAPQRPPIQSEIDKNKNGYILSFNWPKENGSELNHASIEGKTEGKVTFEKVADGFIVSSTQELDCILYGNPIQLYGDEYNKRMTDAAKKEYNKEITHDEYIDSVKELYNGYSIEISGKGPYLMKYSTAEKKWYSYIDKDSDGKFETKLVKGDVNGDGVIDARDATEVLTSFAKTSVGKPMKLNKYYSDVNNDNIIDGRDASQLLTEYAKLSV